MVIMFAHNGPPPFLSNPYYPIGQSSSSLSDEEYKLAVEFERKQLDRLWAWIRENNIMTPDKWIDLQYGHLLQ
jgi:hypothetical protein